MFKDIRTYIILGLSFVIIIFILRSCARPSEQKEADRKHQYETELAINRAEKLEIQARQDSTVKRYKDKLKVDSLNLALQESKIQALKSKLAGQRPQVIEKIQADSAVLSYVTTFEEIITEQQIQIDTLKSQANFQRKINEDLIVAEIMEDKIEADMAIQSSRRISELEKQSRKKERKSRLSKILIPIALVGGFVFGASL